MTWEVTDIVEEKCEKCGSLYHVTSKNFPAKDRGIQNCEVCGHEMRTWKSTVDYFYELVKRGNAR